MVCKFERESGSNSSEYKISAFASVYKAARLLELIRLLRRQHNGGLWSPVVHGCLLRQRGATNRFDPIRKFTRRVELTCVQPDGTAIAIRIFTGFIAINISLGRNIPIISIKKLIRVGDTEDPANDGGSALRKCSSHNPFWSGQVQYL